MHAPFQPEPQRLPDGPDDIHVDQGVFPTLPQTGPQQTSEEVDSGTSENLFVAGPTPVLSVVIPCYNEKNTLSSIVEKVRAQFPENYLEIIVVDDCSVDGTRELLADPLLRSKIDQLVLHPQNMGKGAALRSGFEIASGEIIVVQDADHEYDPSDLRELITPILLEEADVVYGSRFMKEQETKGYSLSYLANKFLTSLSNYCSGTEITDMETCYKMFRREVIQDISIQENRFGFEPEITAKIARNGYKILELPITYKPRTFTDGKKIGWRDAVRALICILKYNFEWRGLRESTPAPDLQ